MDVSTAPFISSSIASHSETPADADSQADQRGAEEDLQRRLLNRIQEQTLPALPPKRWDFLRSSQSVRRISGDASDLIASLKTEFSDAELRAARVLEEGPLGALRLSSVFGDATSKFVIRRDAERLPTDVLSARGLLSNATPEWLHLAAERTSSAAVQPQVVLTAFDDDEMHVFHRLRFKFTSAAGLAMINGENVRQLFTARAPHREQRKYTLMVPGWQIARCINEPTPNIRRAIAHIAEIQRQCGYDPSAVFAVWLPTATEFRDFCRALKFADIRIVSAALRKSLKRSQYSPAAALRLISDRTEISYGVARSQLQRAVESSRLVPRAGEVDVALTKFSQAYEKSVVNKFLVFAVGDGWDEWRSMMAAELAEKWFNLLEIVAAARRVLAGEYPAYRETFDPDLFDVQLRMAREFAKLYRLKPTAIK
jgi:hypothetical protein